MKNRPLKTAQIVLCLVMLVELLGNGCIWWGPERRGERGGRGGGAIIIEGDHERRDHYDRDDRH